MLEIVRVTENATGGFQDRYFKELPRKGLLLGSHPKNMGGYLLYRKGHELREFVFSSTEKYRTENISSVNFMASKKKLFQVVPLEEQTPEDRRFLAEVQHDVLTGSRGLLQWLSILRPTSGADPELFIEEKKSEALVPGWELFRSENKRLDSWKGEPYLDGFAVEFGVQPQKCLQLLSRDIRNKLSMVQAKVYAAGHNFSMKNVFSVPLEVLAALPTERTEFGCIPSQNAYGFPPFVGEGRFVEIRSAGGHIHFGVDYGPFWNAENTVQIMDAIVGLASVGLAEEFDFPIRRRFYGRAGEYRTPKYGLEYRVLSNFWLCHPAIYYLVFELARVGFVWGQMGLSYESLGWSTPQSKVVEAINTGNVKLARTIIKREEKTFQQAIRVSNLQPENVRYHLNTNRRVEDRLPPKMVESALESVALLGIYKGLGALVPHPHKPMENWGINLNGSYRADLPENCYAPEFYRLVASRILKGEPLA